MKGVEKIDIFFENCESITLTPSNIGALTITGISESINRIACNSISLIKHADTFAIEIISDGLEDYAIKRLMLCNDIVGVDITYKNKRKLRKSTSEIIYTSWCREGKCAFDNLYQKTLKGSLGNIYIVIDKEKDIYDFFDKEYLEDEEQIRLTQKMVEE